MFHQGIAIQNDCGFTGNNFKNRGAAGEAILCFSPEQGGGDARCRETAQYHRALTLLH